MRHLTDKQNCVRLHMLDCCHTTDHYQVEHFSHQLAAGKCCSRNNCLGLGHETIVCAVCLYYGFVIWIRGTLVSWWYFPWIGPLAHMFSLVYFSVEVCLEGVFPHCVSTWRDPCVRACAPLTLAFPLTRKQNRTWGDPALHLSQVRGHLEWGMCLPALLGGNLGCWIF